MSAKKLSTKNLTDSLLEAEEFDARKYISSTPPIINDAMAWARDEFDSAVEDGRVHDARSADGIASEIAQDACVEFNLDDNEDYETVVSPLFELAASMFKGSW